MKTTEKFLSHHTTAIWHYCHGSSLMILVPIIGGGTCSYHDLLLSLKGPRHGLHLRGVDLCLPPWWHLHELFTILHGSFVSSHLFIYYFIIYMYVNLWKTLYALEYSLYCYIETARIFTIGSYWNWLWCTFDKFILHIHYPNPRKICFSWKPWSPLLENYL